MITATLTTSTLDGKPYAGNPHVRFDEGEVASTKPRRGSLLYKTFKQSLKVLAVAAGIIGFGSSAFGAWTLDTKNNWLSDGDWTLKCTVSGKSLTISSVQIEGSDQKTLDLADIAGGYVVTSIGNNAFKDRTKISKVILTDAVTSIGTMAFYCCRNLKEFVPFLPASVNTIGASAFNGCNVLASDLNIATNGTTVSFGKDGAGYGPAFSYCYCVSNITIGAGIAELPQYCFRDMVDLQTVTFLGNITLPRNVFAGCVSREYSFFGTASWNREAAYSSFGNAGGYKTRFVIPADDATWQAFYTDTSQVTPASAFTAAQTNKYYEVFGEDATFPLGCIKNTPKETWVVARKVDITGKHPLMVRGVVGETEVTFGATDPEYGELEDVAVPFACSANAYATNGLTLYRCEKSVVEEYDADNMAWINAVTNTGISYEHNPPQDSVKYRLTWIWEPVAYQAKVLAPETLGTVTPVTEPDLHGFYTPGQSVTYTATSGGGTFVRWYGDVSANQVSNTTVSVSCAGEMNLRPYFATNWYYNAKAGTISDGHWTFKVTASGSLLTVKSVSSSFDPMIVDFTKPISDGTVEYSIKSLGGSLFKDNGSLVEAWLPPTLTSIENAVFNGCSNLELIEPFLPPNVNSIGASAFDGCKKVSSPLDLGRGGADIAFGLNGAGYGATFKYCYCVSNITIGAGVISLPQYCFQDMKDIQTVTFLGDITLPRNVFSGCVSREYGFYGSATWNTETSYSSFGNDCNCKTRFIVPRDNESWVAYYTDTTKVKRFADCTTAESNAYLTAFSDGVKPYGLTKANPKNTWIVLRRTGGMKILFR